MHCGFELAPYAGKFEEMGLPTRILTKRLREEVGNAALPTVAPSQVGRDLQVEREELEATQFVVKLMTADATWQQAGEFTQPVLIKVLEGLSDAQLQKLIEACKERSCGPLASSNLALAKEEAELILVIRKYIPQ